MIYTSRNIRYECLNLTSYTYYIGHDIYLQFVPIPILVCIKNVQVYHYQSPPYLTPLILFHSLSGQSDRVTKNWYTRLILLDSLKQNKKEKFLKHRVR